MSEEFIKKSISLRSDIVKYAQKESEKMHGGNFSSFLTYLISCKKNNKEFYHSDKITISKEEYEFLLNCGKTIKTLTDKVDSSTTIVDKTNVSIHYKEFKKLMHLLMDKSPELNNEFDILIRF